ncbi:TetR/AcrR family transcriptional regulator, partial [Mycobacteroides abscessus subsp. massiliense]
MPNRQTVQGVRTGGRSARVREAILDATLGALIDRGYADLTVEAVASRAGVNKTTIYRRWPTLEDLLVETLTTWSLDAIPIPETGSIESDLLATGRDLATVLNDGVGRQVAALVLTAGLRSEQLRETTRRYFEHQAVRATPVVRQAVDRGELPAECDVDTLLATFRAPFFYRMITTGRPIDDTLIVHATQVTLAAARAGLLSK